ncbi:Protein of unknown function (DUF581) [Abeliophyllum distichum]|uniref:FLZ-type domain-containing protein n=1 Tax=Abeliophyllum distichum TaxID=126358 RepID=A0ABD1T2E6_9LAMI
MVGLSVILEGHKDINKRNSQVISKVSFCMAIKTPSTPSSPTPRASNLSPGTANYGFLDHCFLCKQKLLPGKDIYMYKGDKGFCSVECRCRQISMDEESAKAACTRQYKNCSLSSSSRKGSRKRANAFGY